MAGTWTLCRLQWGHRLSVMEILFSRWLKDYEDTGLQWGHRLSAMEIAAEGGGGKDHKVASMGPPPFGDGDPVADILQPR